MNINKLQICICDDETKDCELVQSVIQSFILDIPYEIKVHHDGKELLKDNYIKYDLIFLDIYMNDSQGIEVAQTMRNNGYKNEIVFHTSSKDFALDGYKVHAFDYLVKPIQVDEIEDVLQKYIDLRMKQEKTLTILDSNKNPKYTIPLSKIEYIESTNTWVTIYLNDGHDLRMYTKLSDLEKEIHDPRFLRCHQSYLVNMDYINQTTDVFKLTSGKIVPIRVRKKKQIQDEFLQYIFKK